MQKPGGKTGSGITPIIVAGLCLVIVFLYAQIIKPAIAASSSMNQMEVISATSFPIAKIFTVLFLMLGPFKIAGPFAKMTHGADNTLTRKTAFQGIFFSCLALLFAAFMGETFLSNYGIPLPILAPSGGFILLLTALISIIQQFKPSIPHVEEAVPPTLKSAISPLAFPTVVTPYGIAALIVFLAISSDLHNRLVIGVIVLVIMLLNLVIMLITRYVFQILGIFLQIVAAVLGIIQVALGFQVINNSLKELLK
jgi:multiple antibiotic resistance protein